MGRLIKGIAVAAAIGVLGFGEGLPVGGEKAEKGYCFLAKIYTQCREIASQKGYSSVADCKDEGAAVSLVVVGELSKDGVVGEKLTQVGGIVYSICQKGCLKDPEVERKLKEKCPAPFQE